MGMSPPTVVRMGEYIVEQIPKFRQALEQGEANEAYLKGLLEEQRAENVKVRRALSIMDPDEAPPPKPKKKVPTHVGRTRSNGTATGHGISAEAADPFVTEMLRRTDAGEKFFSQRDIYQALGVEQSPASSAFRFLRDIGFLRKAGRFNDDDPRRRAEAWTVMDRDAYAKFMQQITSNDNNGGVAA